MTSPRPAAIVVAGLMLGATAVLPWGSAARADDGDVVFCLGFNRSRLIDTAAMLGLADRAATPAGQVLPRSDKPAEPGAVPQPMTLEDWRDEHEPDFDRACQALITSVQLEKSGRAAGPSQLSTMLTVLLPLLTGSLLTWLIGLQMASFNGRQATAVALRTSMRLLRSETALLVASLSSERAKVVPPTDQLWRARADLVAHLEQVRAKHSKWTVPGQVIEALYDRSFMGDFTPVRFGSTAESRRRAEEEVLKRVDELAGRVEAIALALQQPFRRHSELGGP